MHDWNGFPCSVTLFRIRNDFCRCRLFSNLISDEDNTQILLITKKLNLWNRWYFSGRKKTPYYHFHKEKKVEPINYKYFPDCKKKRQMNKFSVFKFIYIRTLVIAFLRNHSISIPNKYSTFNVMNSFIFINKS